MNCTEYIKGGIACRKGKPCPENAHKDFIRGYSWQYELEQILDHRSLGKENEHIQKTIRG